MKHLLIILLTLLSVTQISGTELNEETLRYKVLYKWGLIQKQAGNATINLNRIPGGYKATLMPGASPSR